MSATRKSPGRFSTRPLFSICFEKFDPQKGMQPEDRTQAAALAYDLAAWADDGGSSARDVPVPRREDVMSKHIPLRGAPLNPFTG